MKKLICVAFLIVAALAAAQDDDNPGSLWPKSYRSPLLDRTARGIGDILTVVISETSSSTFAASTSATKKDDTTVNPANIPLLNWLNVPLLNQIFGGGSTGANSTVSGSGQTSQTGRFTARMSVMVKEVLPNGNLVIEGVRWIKVNNETQSFKLTGIIRRDDIRSDNTILSENIAEAQIKAEGKGTVAERQRKGVITQLLDWLF